MPSSLLARQPVGVSEAENAEGREQTRLLGLPALISLGFSGLIGTGIFVMIGMAAHDVAGPAISLSFIVAAVACASVALCYAEFASAVPRAGSAYAYAYATLGELPAWLIGWNILFSYGLAAASITQGWSHYFQAFVGQLGVTVPSMLSAGPFDNPPSSGATSSLCDLPALLAALGITFLIVRGIKISLRANLVMLVIKLSIIAFVIVAGLFFIHPENWRPFAPFGLLMKSGAGGQPVGMIAGAAIVFYAFMGFEALSAYTEECRRPKRDVPISILVSVLLATMVYIAVAVVLTGMVRYDHISARAPISDAFRQAGLPWAEFLVSLGALTGITSVLFIILMTLPRVLMAMGRDGLLPSRFFSEIHPTFHTPWKAMLLTGIGAGVLGALVPLQSLMQLLTLSTLGGYVVICAAVLILRRNPEREEGRFQAPAGPLFPLLGIATCLLLVSSLPRLVWIQLAAWLVLGIGVYFLYGRRNSVLTQATSGAEGQPVFAVVEENARN